MTRWRVEAYEPVGILVFQARTCNFSATRGTETGAWPKLNQDFRNEPTLADTILDRIIPRAHRIELKGKNRRKKLKNQSS